MTNDLLVAYAVVHGYEHVPRHHAVLRGTRSGFSVEALRSIAVELGYDRLSLALRCTGALTWDLRDKICTRTPDGVA